MVAAWLLLLFVLAVTISPIADRPQSGMPVHFERAGAFALIGFLFAFAYPHRLLQVFAILIAAAAGFEVLQGLSPERHPRMMDMLVKAAGGMVGATIGWFCCNVVEKMRKPVSGSQVEKEGGRRDVGIDHHQDAE